MIKQNDASLPSGLELDSARLCAWMVLVISVCGASRQLSADISWPGKTGPMSCGVANSKDTENLPTRWGEAQNQNIAWKIELEGLGHSTPVIGSGRAWFTSATEDGKQQYIYCVATESGKILHHELLFQNEDPEPLGNPVNSYASPTCVLTEDALYVHFGTYGTARLDPNTADVVWQRRDINCRHFRGPGSSPVLFQDLLILTFDGIDQQFLTALNIKTGDTVWRTERTTDYGDLKDGKPLRDGDLRKAYGTPGIVYVGDQAQVVSVGSRAAFGYDAITGKELWTITHDDYNAAAQPIPFGDTVILNTGSRGANLLAVKLNASTRGNVNDSHVVWNREKGNSRLCFPVLWKGMLYSLTDNGVLTCVDAKTGEEVWTGRVGGNFVASPVIANDLIYVFDEAGRGTVLKTGDHFVVVAKNQLAEGGKASPAIAEGAIFLRTSGHLYKLSKE